MNVPPTVGMALSSGLVTMTELCTTIGIEQLHDILEVMTVDAYNRRIAAERARREQEK